MLYFFNTKAKAFTVFLFAVSFLGIFVLSSLVATQICQKWYGFAIGIAMMIIAIPFHCLGKKMMWGHLASFLLNSFASGFVASAYYIKSERTLDIFDLLIAAAPAAAIVFLVFLVLHSFKRSKTVTVIVAVILNTVLSVLAIVFWINDGSVAFSFAFFCSLISFFYLCVFGITVNHDERSVFRDISFGSFGSFIIISVVVAFLISDGELIENLDFSGAADDKKAGKNKKA